MDLKSAQAIVAEIERKQREHERARDEIERKIRSLSPPIRCAIDHFHDDAEALAAVVTEYGTVCHLEPDPIHRAVVAFELAMRYSPDESSPTQRCQPQAERLPVFDYRLAEFWFFCAEYWCEEAEHST